MPIQAVFFDIGETLINETRAWSLWADALRVPRLTFFALLGAVIERGEHHRHVFDYFPEAAVAAARMKIGTQTLPIAVDLYPDAVPCLRELRARGIRVGLAGNQPAGAEEALRLAGVPADIVASSATWSVEKPSVEFFHRIIEVAGMEASAIAYVGDRLDNDVLPAREAGMVTVFVRRGPWGYLHAERPEVEVANYRVDSLEEIPDLLAPT